MIKKNNGITLPTLIIYITIMFVVLALVMRLAITFKKNVGDTTDVTLEEETEKLSMYMLQETEKSGNEIWQYDENSIRFTNNNRIVFKDEDNDGVGQIYYNDIVICNNVNNCTFTVESDDETNIVTITINITINDRQIQKKYYINNSTKIQSNIRIPVQYQEVEYIQSTGLQYIDTLFVPNQDTSVELVMTGLVKTGSQDYFGTSKTSDGYVYGIYDGGSYVYDNYNDDKKVYNAHISGNMTITKNKNVTTVTGDNNFSYTHDATTFTASHSLYLFARWKSNGAYRPAKMKCYSFKIWDNNTLVRNFVPCYRKADGEVGLYDIVEEKFYTNSGSGEFLKGDSIRFEDTFQEVEYIETTGTQWIDANYELQGDLKFEGAVYTEIQNTEMAVVGTVEQENQIEVGFSTTNNRFFTFSNNTSAGLTLTSPNSIYGTKFNFTAKYNSTDPYKELYLKVNDTDFSNTSSSSNTNYTGNHLELFRVYTIMPFKGRLYFLKVYENNILVRDFIPCYRKSNGEIGLFDIVNSKFYANSGTGEFLKGNNINHQKGNIQTDLDYVQNSKIPKEYQQVYYIESTGAQYINTGYNASYKSRIYADFQYTDLSVQSRVFGSRAASGENYLTYEAYINGNGYYAWACKDGEGNWASTDVTATKARVKIDSNSYQSSIDYTGGITYSNTITTTRSKTTKNPICIFSSYYNGNACNFGKLKLYSLFIENEGVKVRDFVPCYRKADGVIGLYDLIEGGFYTNQGTGYLIKGPEVYE